MRLVRIANHYYLILYDTHIQEYVVRGAQQQHQQQQQGQSSVLQQSQLVWCKYVYKLVQRKNLLYVPMSTEVTAVYGHAYVRWACRIQDDGMTLRCLIGLREIYCLAMTISIMLYS